MSNSGKTRMGRFIPYFHITNTASGKLRKVGLEYTDKRTAALTGATIQTETTDCLTAGDTGKGKA